MSTREELLKAAKALEEMERRRTFSAMDFYVPYPKQRDFFDLGLSKYERLLMAANRIGKSMAGSFETACHLTGRYPEWWLGRRWSRPVNCWAAGETSLLTRNVSQTKLCGQYGNEAKYGTGMIPRSCVDWKEDVSLARGVTDAFDTVFVKHVSGGKSVLQFKSYEQGRAKFQGDTIDFIWFDEEPPEDIYAEGLTRTATTDVGMGMVFITFTPLLGASEVVRRFTDNSSADRGLVTMTIDDAQHITAEDRAKIVASYLPHEREARAKGIPMLGSGKIFQVTEESIAEDAIPVIPPHWPLLWSIDFGSTHPFAAVLNAWDRDNDCIHVVAEVRMKDARPIDHAAALKPFGKDIPVAWPHDGSRRESSLEPLQSLYKKHGLHMNGSHATFKDGSISTEAGISEMIERMTTGRYKVAKHLTLWWDEFRLYHRKDGLIVKERDDLMSASRVGVMTIRTSKPVFMPGYGNPGGRSEAPIARDTDINPFTGAPL